jgi:hypothetical protein
MACLFSDGLTSLKRIDEIDNRDLPEDHLADDVARLDVIGWTCRKTESRDRPAIPAFCDKKEISAYFSVSTTFLQV